MEAITLAIESWGVEIVRHNSDAFIYRGANLRYAVERTLFFRFANDALLQKRFDDLTDGKPLFPVLLDNWNGVIAAHLSCDPLAKAKRKSRLPALGFGRRIRNIIGNARRIGRRPYDPKGLRAHPETMFLVIHPKFVNFLTPVVNEMGSGAAFLTLRSHLVEADLTRKGLSYVALRETSTAPKSQVLQHFPELCEGYDCMAAVFDDYRPSVVVVPEGNAPVYELALRAGLPRGVRTVCLQHGAPAYSNPGFRNWNFADVLVWGNAFIEPYARHNPDQHFTVTGTPALLPAPRASTANSPISCISFFLQKGATVIPEKEWDALLHFIRWVATNFADLKIIIRDHPTQPGLTESERGKFDPLANVRFMPTPQYSLSDVLAISDVVVAAASTTLLEAVQAGAIPFIFGTDYPKDFPDIAGAGAAIAAPDGPAAQTALKRLVESMPFRAALRRAGEKLRPLLFAASGPSGVARIALVLRTISSARADA